MSTKEDDAIRRLSALFADPQPGLATWRAFVARAVRDAGITESAIADATRSLMREHIATCPDCAASIGVSVTEDGAKVRFVAHRV